MNYIMFSSTYTLNVLLSTCVMLISAHNLESHHKIREADSITFTLFATEMSGCDSNSACDLFVTINCASQSSDWQNCGQTSKRQDDNNPVWPEVFTFPHLTGTSQRWRFDLYDADVAFDDLIASIEIEIDEYANAPGNLFQIPVPGNTGIFWIHRQR